jgi:hypothetical protein
VLLQLAVQGIASLNQRHGPAADGVSASSVSSRADGAKQSASDGLGTQPAKLHEFNGLRAAPETHHFRDGWPTPPWDVRYVIRWTPLPDYPLRGAAGRHRRIR